MEHMSFYSHGISLPCGTHQLKVVSFHLGMPGLFEFLRLTLIGKTWFSPVRLLHMQVEFYVFNGERWRVLIPLSFCPIIRHKQTSDSALQALDDGAWFGYSWFRMDVTMGQMRLTRKMFPVKTGSVSNAYAVPSPSVGEQRDWGPQILITAWSSDIK